MLYKKFYKNFGADPPTNKPQNHSFNKVLASGDLKNETGRVFLGRIHYISAQKVAGEPENSYFLFVS